jgi:hypothetical protein
MKKVLYLTLHRCWFDKIASGEKTVEYRARTPFWERRLAKPYDQVRFRNGYRRDAPTMRVEFRGVTTDGDSFGILLGRILETKNYHP